MWTRATSSPFSTESALPSTWPLDRCASELVARLHHCDQSAAAAIIAAHAKHHADEAWVDGLLARLSAPALAVLEALADAGGFLHIHELEADLHHRHALGHEEVQAALAQCLPPLVVVPLASPRGSAVALVATAADRIAQRVAGLGEAVVHAAALEPVPGDDGRALLAIAAWLAQTDLKLTQAGEPHKTGVKRIAKLLGVAEALVEARARTAWRIGLVREAESGVLRPDATALAAAASGRFPHSRMAGAVAERLRVLGQPISLAAVARWAESCAERGIFTTGAYELATLPGISLVVDPSVRSAKPGKTSRGRGSDVHPDLADESRYLIAAPLPDAAAVTVTPSFEVFIAPEARLSDLVAIVPLCEPGRLDRVIVGRLTKASVLRAAAFGRTADDILASLGAASRTPVPDNVTATIRDWLRSSTTAFTTVGRVIVVAPDLQDRLVNLLPPSADARLVAPGVIVCANDLAERVVSIAFDKLGIVAQHDPETMLPSPFPNPDVALPGLVTAPDTLRARLARYRAGDRDERAKIQPTIDQLAALPRPASPATGTRRMSAPSEQLFNNARDARGEHDARVGADADDDAAWDDAWDDAPPALHRLVASFEHQLGIELSIAEYGALLFALTQLAAPERTHVFAVRDRASAVARLEALVAARIARVGDRDGRLRKALDVLGAQPSFPPPPSRPPSVTDAPPDDALEWHRTNLIARLDAAVRVQARLLLDLGDRRQEIHVRSIVQRGDTLMLLGDDPRDVGIALRVVNIQGLAELPATPAAPTRTPPPGEAPASSRWSPVTGMPAPSGHAPCPCGSGKRYRQCCRDAPG